MADGVKIEIVSPERLILSEMARSVVVPGADGYFTVMGDHAPLMSTLKPGFITVTDEANVGACLLRAWWVCRHSADRSDDPCRGSPACCGLQPHRN